MARLLTLGGLALEPAVLSQPKPLLLLAYLALEGRQPRRRLAELFWPDGRSLKSLSMAITRLHQALPDCCQTDGSHVWSQTDCDAVDLFQAIDAGAVTRAMGLYRGPFLGGLAQTGWSPELESWVQASRERLADRLRTLLIERAESLAGTGQADEAAGLAAAAWNLEGAVPAEPAMGRRLYALLSGAGHPLAAEVQADLEELAEGTHAGGPSVVARPDMRPPGTSFVGREQELAQIAARLERPGCRLLTLVGQGGVGKTRLALEAARAALDWGSFPDGVWVARLEVLTSEEQLPHYLAQVSGAPLRSSVDGWKHLADVVSDRRILLLLDNAEHLLAAVPRLGELLQATSHLKLLVTSRERLGLAEESLLSIGGLPWPVQGSRWEEAMASPAVRLLRDRALAVHGGLDLAGQAAGVLELCASLGGLPLGLEMAAGLLRLMPAKELARLIGQDPGLLQATVADAPVRHGSLRTIMDASWERLAPGLREALGRLSVFVGGFGPQAALEVCGVAPAALARLAEASWLQASPDGRFDLHPYVLAYARARLADRQEEVSSVKEAHAAWHLALAREADSRAIHAGQKERMPVLAREHANLLAALDHYADADPRAALELAARLGDFWTVQGHYAAGLAQLQRVLGSAGDDALGTWARLRAGHLAWRKGELELARGFFLRAEADAARLYAAAEPAEAMATETTQPAVPKAETLLADALLGLGQLAYVFDGDFGTARERFAASLLHARLGADLIAASDALRMLGSLDTNQGDYAQAKRQLQASLDLAERSGDELTEAKVSINLATVLSYLGEQEQARHLNERSLAILHALGDKHGQAVVLINLGMAASEEGRQEEGKRLYARSLALFRELGDRRSVCHLLNNIAGVHQTMGEPRLAQPLLEESLATLRGLGDVALISHALFLYAKVHLDLGEREAAKRRLDACIDLCRRNDERWALMRALAVLARWHAEAGEHAAASTHAMEAEAMAKAAGDINALRTAQEVIEQLSSAVP